MSTIVGPIRPRDPNCRKGAIRLLSMQERTPNAREFEYRARIAWKEAVWTPKTMLPGDLWDEARPDSLREADAILVFVNAHRARSPEDQRGMHYASDEVAMAVDMATKDTVRQRIVLVIAEGFEEHLPYGMRRMAAEPVFLSHYANPEDAIAAIEELLARE